MAAYIVFAAIFSPTGVHARQYPEILVFFVGGAIWGHPVLFSLWAGLGPGPFFRRSAIAAFFCLLVACADALAASRRGSLGPGDLVFGIVIAMASFSLWTLALGLLRRFFGWQIACDGVVSPRSDRRTYRFQFGLRLLLLWTTLVACVLALYHSRCPEGTATEIAAELWRQFGRRTLSGIAVCVAVYLPTVIIPWVTLAYRGRGTFAVLATTIASAILSFGAILAYSWIVRWPFIRCIPIVVSGQLGAAAAGLVAALVLRFCGYRIVRSEKPESAPNETEVV